MRAALVILFLATATAHAVPCSRPAELPSWLPFPTTPCPRSVDVYCLACIPDAPLPIHLGYRVDSKILVAAWQRAFDDAAWTTAAHVEHFPPKVERRSVTRLEAHRGTRRAFVAIWSNDPDGSVDVVVDL
jgi:hypothetical protein